MAFKDPEKAKAYKAKHYQENRDRYLERVRRWQQVDHVEEYRAGKRKYWAENSERLNANKMAYYYANHARIRAERRAQRLQRRDAINAAGRAYYYRTREQRQHNSALYYVHNRVTILAKVMKWTQENPDKVRTNKRRWAKTNHAQVRVVAHRRRERARSLPDTFTPADYQRMMQYWHYACAVCGNQEGFTWTLAMDHWICLHSPDCPGNVATNIIPLCHGEGGCNNSKGKADGHTWLVKRVGARKARVIEQAIAAYFAWVQTPHALDPS